MKITIFGSTGGIGKWIVELALQKGYEVVAYLRNPSKMDIVDKNLTLVKGEIFALCLLTFSTSRS